MSDDQDGCEWVNVFFRYRPTRVVLDKRLLNSCVCVLFRVIIQVDKVHGFYRSDDFLVVQPTA